MPRTTYSPKRTGNEAIDRNLLEIQQAVVELAANPLAESVLLTGKAIATTDTRVYHNLGRTPRGWIVVGLNSSAVIFEGTAPTADEKRIFLNLRASAGTPTVSLLVF